MNRSDVVMGLISLSPEWVIFHGIQQNMQSLIPHRYVYTVTLPGVHVSTLHGTYPTMGVHRGHVTLGMDGGELDRLTSWLGFAYTSPSAVESPPPVFAQTSDGRGELNAMLIGVAPSASKRYLSARNQRTYFVSMRERSSWLVGVRPNWGDGVVDFITSEPDVVKNAIDTIRGKASSTRFWNIIRGLGDFAKFGGRYQQLINGCGEGGNITAQSRAVGT